MSKRKGNAVSVDFILGLVFSIIGSVFVIVAVCFAVFQVQFEKNAVETSAVITRIESYRDGQVYLFSSEPTWLNPNNYIGSYVDVYVDSSDMSRYFVDADSLNLQENNAVIHDYR